MRSHEEGGGPILIKMNLQDDDVVISGVSMWFPGVTNFTELSEKLTSSIPIRPRAIEKVTLGYVGEVPEHARLLDSAHHMDHTFFGLSRQVSVSVDYLTRKLLEKAFEALVDAGLNPIDAQEVVCDVYQNTLIADGEMSPLAVGTKETYAITGRNRGMSANRISFFLNATGCSNSRDSGYLGGMQGVDSAVNAIRRGRADMVIVCGGNLMSDPHVTQQYNDLDWLCMDGKTRAFDNEASGFVTSEGIAALIIQRGKDAKRIYAKIRHVSVSSGIKTNAMTRQTEENWVKTLSEFYTASKIPVSDVFYLEAYGSGLKEMDKEELNAVTKVLCKDRDSPLLIGSVKSNIGHLEAGADFASIMKAIVCFETGKIPCNENYSSPNRSVRGLVTGQLKVVEQVTPLPENGLIGISGWAFGGVYGHLVLEGFSKPKQAVTLSIPRLVPLSARTDDFIPPIIQQLENNAFDPEYLQLVTDVFGKKINMFLGRGYVILPKGETSLSHYEKYDDMKRPLWFVFSGMGSQWQAMGKTLMRLPVIRESIERSHRTLQTIANIDLIHIITTEDPAIFDNILHSFVGIAAIQIALVDMLKLLKISPDGIVGHSVGELGCSYMDGCLTAEQMISAAYYRGKASLDATLERGFMAAVGKGYEEIKDELPDGVEVACHNSSTSCTLSGRAEAVSKYVEVLKARGIFARTVNVANIAYHSTYIKPAAPFLLNYLKKVIPNPLPRSSKWISSSVPEAEWSSERSVWCSAEYHTNNLLGSVLFEEASRHIPENAVVVEVAPHGLLQAILKRSLGPDVTNIPLTNRMAKDPLAHLLEAIGKIYVAGYVFDVNALYPKIEYPVGRGTGQLQQLVHWLPHGDFRITESPVPKLTLNIRRALRECDNALFGCELAGKRIFPISVFVHLLEKLLAQYMRCLNKKMPLCFSDFRLHATTELSIEHDELVEGSILLGNNRFEITKTDRTLVASGSLIPMEDKSVEELSTLPNDGRVITAMQKEEIYHWFRKHGYIFSDALHSLQSVEITTAGVRAKVAASCSPFAKLEALLQLLMLDASSESKQVLFPYLIQEMRIDPIPECSSDMDAWYDRGSGVVLCPGLSISGVKFREIRSEETPLSFHSIKTLPYNNPPFASRGEFLGFCCDLIGRSKQTEEQVKILELEGGFPLLAPEIKAVSPLTQVEIKGSKMLALGLSPVDLVVCGNRRLDEAAVYAQGFILVRGHSPVKVPAGYLEVSSFSSGKSDELHLLKKKIVLNGERNFIAIPQSKAELLMLLRSRKSKSVLVVGFKEPAEGISHFQESIQSLVNISIKWLFILDESAPDFSVSNPFYQQQLVKGLPLSVFKNGEWNFVYKERLDAGLKDKLTSTQDITVAEVCGTVGADRIGVPSIGSSNDSYDPVLTWPKPSSWSAQDATFVPVAYSLAYHCLKVIGGVRPYERVLVTDGMSVGGQAGISVALSLAARVFVTVGTTEEVDQLKTLFPKILPDDILLHTDKHFGMRLKLSTGESNPEIVYNFLDGAGFTTCYENIGIFGKIFHLGRADIASNTKIGMSRLLRSVSLYAVTPAQINKWPEEEKKAVHDLIAEGIKSGVVRPLAQAITKTAESEISPSKGLKIQRQASKWQRSNQFAVSSTAAYAVIGEASEVDLDIAEWLARRGAKHILICNPALMSNLQYQRKAKSLMLRHSANVYTYDEQGLKKAMKDTPIGAIFFVNLLDVGNAAAPLSDHVFKTEAQHLVTISRSREYVLKMRTATGMSCSYTNILWKVDGDLLGQNMDLIAPFIGINAEIAVTDERRLRLTKKAIGLLEESTPESVAEYIHLGKSLVSTEPFIELPTAGLRSENKMEVSPVFFFPGVENDRVELVAPLVRHLTYPAFVATVPHMDMLTVSNIAAALIPKMTCIQSHKTFNIVGLSAGCALAIELTRQLESLGASVALLLVDNPTVPLQQGLPSVQHFQSAFLDVLGLKTEKMDEQVEYSSLPWSARMNHVVSCLDLPPSADYWVIKAVKYINNTFSAMLNYQVDGVEIKGPLTILRSSESGDSFNYNKLCLNNKNLEVSVTRKALQRSSELKALLEKFVISDTMSPQTVHDCLWPQFEDLLQYRATLQ